MTLKDNRRLWIVAGSVLLLLIFWAGMKYADLRAESVPKADNQELLLEEPLTPVEPAESSLSTVKVAKIKVYVAGAVDRPDVYELDQGARVYEALLAAGPEPGADLASLGMARKLQDGETLYVCRPGEEAPLEVPPNVPVVNATGILESAGPQVDSANSSSNGLLNINTASLEELDRVLPGVGPALAGRIVDYRANNGPFAELAQLKEVSGIGDKKYEAIKDLITVN